MNRSDSPAHRALVRELTQVRQSIGLTQSELAEKLGVQASLVGRIEAGERRIDMIEGVHLARALGIDPIELMALVDRTMAQDERW